jgi:hypothetical protein
MIALVYISQAHVQSCILFNFLDPQTVYQSQSLSHTHTQLNIYRVTLKFIIIIIITSSSLACDNIPINLGLPRW